MALVTVWSALSNFRHLDHVATLAVGDSRLEPAIFPGPSLGAHLVSNEVEVLWLLDLLGDKPEGSRKSRSRCSVPLKTLVLDLVDLLRTGRLRGGGIKFLEDEEGASGPAEAMADKRKSI